MSRRTEAGRGKIQVVHTDGTNQSTLTNNSSASDSYPTLSPDGKMMAFERARYDDSGKYVSEIYLMNLD